MAMSIRLILLIEQCWAEIALSVVEKNKLLSEASEKTFGNLKNVTNISNVCKGKRKKAGGYHWKILDEE